MAVDRKVVTAWATNGDGSVNGEPWVPFGSASHQWPGPEAIQAASPLVHGITSSAVPWMNNRGAAVA